MVRKSMRPWQRAFLLFLVALYGVTLGAILIVVNMTLAGTLSAYWLPVPLLVTALVLTGLRRLWRAWRALSQPR
jgi:hypothetical protein